MVFTTTLENFVFKLHAPLAGTGSAFSNSPQLLTNSRFLLTAGGLRNCFLVNDDTSFGHQILCHVRKDFKDKYPAVAGAAAVAVAAAVATAVARPRATAGIGILNGFE